MKLHIVNYQLQILRLSLLKPVESSDSPHPSGDEPTAQNLPARKPRA
jgi:hypothetical protein